MLSFGSSIDGIEKEGIAGSASFGGCEARAACWSRMVRVKGKV